MPARKKRSKFRFRLLVSEEYRPMQLVPVRSFITIWILVFVTLFLQVRINLERPPPQTDAIHLPSALSEVKLSALSLGDEVFTAKAVMLWLQAFDNQQGQSLSYVDLDYNKIAEWLENIVDLDPLSEYPFMTAAHVYTSLLLPEQTRIMVDFISREFEERPDLRWQWMASAVTLAKNQVEDTEYALELAKVLREKTEGIEGVPSWARQMDVFLLQELNSYDASAQLLLSLIRSGEITDPQEFALHIKRLTELRETMLREGKIKDRKTLESMQQLLDLIQTEYIRANSDITT